MSVPPNLVRHLCKIMLQWSPLWLATTAASTALGFGYILFFKEDVWVASQALIIRDEVGGTMNRQGRFDNKESLKAAQDTILEIARNPQVVQQALKSQLPADAPPITEKDVNGFIGGQLSVRSPKGSEFGTTEIFYVDVRHNEQEQAIQLNQAICTALERRLQDIRMTRYLGIVNELKYALDIAKEEQATATEHLKKIENDVGENLTDLRSLTDSPSAGGTAKLLLDQLASERRQAESQTRQHQEELRFLELLEDDPARVLVAPSNVLNSQPGLKRLCEGLVDSQLQELQLSGRFTDAHPSIRAAKIAREAIRVQLGTELKLARASLQSEINVTEQRVKSLDEQIQKSQDRFAELANIRADYANALAEVRNRTSIIEQIERDLAAADANRRAADQSSLITRIDSPVLSDKPIGPGAKTLLLAAIMAGFLSGVGLILLVAPIDLGIRHGRRWSDHIYAAHQAAGRPATEPSPAELASALSPAPNSAPLPATSLPTPQPLAATSAQGSQPSQPQPAVAPGPTAVDRRTSNPAAAPTASPSSQPTSAPAPTTKVGPAVATLEIATPQNASALNKPVTPLIDQSTVNASPSAPLSPTSAASPATASKAPSGPALTSTVHPSTASAPTATKPATSESPPAGKAPSHLAATAKPASVAANSAKVETAELILDKRLSMIATEISARSANAEVSQRRRDKSAADAEGQTAQSTAQQSTAADAAATRRRPLPETESESNGERRTRPRLPPAAIFTTSADGKPASFGDPVKLAT